MLPVFRGKTQAAKDVSGRVPLEHYWDTDEPKLLVVQARYQADEGYKEVAPPVYGSIPLTKAVLDETVS